jgi:fibrillarin-like rRNA methylase
MNHPFKDLGHQINHVAHDAGHAISDTANTVDHVVANNVGNLDDVVVDVATSSAAQVVIDNAVKYLATDGVVIAEEVVIATL